MGWSSATSIFDVVIEAAYRLQIESANATTAKQEHRAIVKFAKAVRDELEAGDWDCQRESEYWEMLAKDLWPEDWKEYLEWRDDG